ncbi:MAG: DoxX family membrane protein [Phycisphaerales bacterium]
MDAASAVEVSGLSATPAERWNPLTKLAFLWVFFYVMVAYGLTLLAVFPVLGMAAYWVQQAWVPVVVWVGKSVFGATVQYAPNGSGDTSFNWVQVFCELCLAGVLAMITLVCTWRVKRYSVLFEVLRITVRYVLAINMVSYGLAKIFEGQFPAPEVTRLMQPYGESSPMGLLWTFMGASKPYTFIAGLAEFVGGVLLLFRRTTLLGALVVAGVMLNVVLLNFCYDVPVKLFSTQLLLMALWLALPDAGRLLNVLLLNRPAPPRELAPAWLRGWGGVVRWVLKTPYVLWLLGSMAYGMAQTSAQFGPGAPRGPLNGAWKVVEFTHDGKVLPALADDPVRWRVIHIHQAAAGQELPMGGDAVVIAPMSGASKWMKLNVHDTTLELRWFKQRGVDPGPEAPADGSFSFALVPRTEDGASGQLTLDGSLEGKPCKVTMQPVRREDFLLVNRGFHWVNEYPFNR